jgi:hypothetical protein
MVSMLHAVIGCSLTPNVEKRRFIKVLQQSGAEPSVALTTSSAMGNCAGNTMMACQTRRGRTRRSEEVISIAGRFGG